MGDVVAESGRRGLRLILWAAWDPIGGVPRDEYENYAPRIVSLLRRGAKPDEVAAVLGEIRTETIGLPANPPVDRAVSAKLRDWYEHPFFGSGYISPAELT